MVDEPTQQNSLNEDDSSVEAHNLQEEYNSFMNKTYKLVTTHLHQVNRGNRYDYEKTKLVIRRFASHCLFDIETYYDHEVNTDDFQVREDEFDFVDVIELTAIGVRFQRLAEMCLKDFENVGNDEMRKFITFMDSDEPGSLHHLLTILGGETKIGAKVYANPEFMARMGLNIRKVES